MKEWIVSGVVSGSKYLGKVKADTAAEAKALGWALDTYISFCHECADECEDPEVTDIMVSVNDPGEDE